MSYTDSYMSGYHTFMGMMWQMEQRHRDRWLIWR